MPLMHANPTTCSNNVRKPEGSSATTAYAHLRSSNGFLGFAVAQLFQGVVILPLTN